MSCPKRAQTAPNVIVSIVPSLCQRLPPPLAPSLRWIASPAPIFRKLKPLASIASLNKVFICFPFPCPKPNVTGVPFPLRQVIVCRNVLPYLGLAPSVTKFPLNTASPLLDSSSINASTFPSPSSSIVLLHCELVASAVGTAISFARSRAAETESVLGTPCCVRMMASNAMLAIFFCSNMN